MWTDNLVATFDNNQVVYITTTLPTLGMILISPKKGSFHSIDSDVMDYRWVNSILSNRGVSQSDLQHGKDCTCSKSYNPRVNPMLLISTNQLPQIISALVFHTDFRIRFLMLLRPHLHLNTPIMFLFLSPEKRYFKSPNRHSSECTTEPGTQHRMMVKILVCEQRNMVRLDRFQRRKGQRQLVSSVQYLCGGMRELSTQHCGWLVAAIQVTRRAIESREIRITLK